MMSPSSPGAARAQKGCKIVPRGGVDFPGDCPRGAFKQREAAFFTLFIFFSFFFLFNVTPAARACPLVTGNAGKEASPCLPVQQQDRWPGVAPARRVHTPDGEF